MTAASHHFLLPALGFALLAAVAAAVRTDVLELGDADFDYLATEHETMLVKFYAPWCLRLASLCIDVFCWMPFSFKMTACCIWPPQLYLSSLSFLLAPLALPLDF